MKLAFFNKLQVKIAVKHCPQNRQTMPIGNFMVLINLGNKLWLVVLGFNATLTAKVISWQSVTHMCFLAFSHQY